jgi:dynein heavy chain
LTTNKTLSTSLPTKPNKPITGSFVINPRLQRLFVTLAVAFPGSDALMRVFGALLGGHLSRFSADAQEAGTRILQAALALHERVAGAFRKTAVNFHYEFTVRHLAGVFQGLLMAGPDVAGSPVKLARLWLHESERVYADRLVSPAVRLMLVLVQVVELGQGICVVYVAVCLAKHRA